MKKYISKLVAAVLAVAMVTVLFTGCGSGNKTNTTSAKEGKKLKAALVTAQRLGDKGVTDLCNEGFMKAAKEFGYETQVVEVQKGEYEESMRALAEEDYDVIVTLWMELVDATSKVAPQYPNVKFISVLGNIKQSNVMGILGKEHEGSYVAGVEAGMISKAGHIGFIGGQDNPEINRFLAGYEQGAKSVNPNIKIDAVYVGSFEDPTKCKDLALMLYNQGADIVYTAAAKSGLGMFDAAKETGKYAIGCDVNQNNLVPGQVIGSMTIAYDKWIYEGMKQVAKNAFKAGVYEFGVDGNYVGLTLPTDDQFKVPDDVKKACEEAAKRVANGEVKVDPIPSKDK
jgi:basic membrane protein A